MKKSLFLFYLFFLSFSHTSFSRIIEDNFKAIYLQAEDYFVNENYTAALPLYLKSDSMEQGNSNLNFKIGICYLKSSTYKTKSIPYLEVAIKQIAKLYEEKEIKEKQAPLSSYYYLGRAYHLNYEFDKAIEMYQKYIDALGTEPKYATEVAEVTHDIETCNFGKELVKNPKKINVENLGEGINTKYPEYSPVVSLDEQTLIFTSRREGGMSSTILPNGEYYEDIFISTNENGKWGKAIPVGSNINSFAHEATINLSADGQKLIIYKDDGGNGNIYISELQGTEWGYPEYASAPINTSSWESHACLSSDNRILYFVSNKAGGYGGRDIYKCLKLPNGKWGPSQNLGPVINTKYDEDGVFIHPDGRQIFFSSRGHNSMGGFDIFTSTINDENGNWTEPINYGYPVNTTDDDVFLITSADGNRAYFSSDKEGGFGEKDIYMIKLKENENPRDISILLGKIINKSKETISNNKIYIINTEKGDTVQSLSANSSSGKYGANLPVGGKYKIVYKINGKEIFSETIEVTKGQGYQVLHKEVIYNGDSTLTDLEIATLKALENKNSTADKKNPCNGQNSNYQLFFGYNTKEINEGSKDFKAFIDILSECLLSNPNYVISIESSASTVPSQTHGSNEKLAELRAASAKEKVLEALLKKGLKKSQIVFSKPTAIVQGPEYKKDAQQNRTTYGLFQYVKIKATPNQ